MRFKFVSWRQSYFTPTRNQRSNETKYLNSIWYSQLYFEKFCSWHRFSRLHDASKRGKSLLRKRMSLCTVTSLRDIPEKASTRAIRFANCTVCYIRYILLEISLQRGEDFRESQDLELCVLQNDGRILFDMCNSNVCECPTEANNTAQLKSR